MQGWEIEKIYIPLENDFEGRRGLEQANIEFSYYPDPEESGESEWNRAKLFAHEGWELVGAIPIIGGHGISVREDGLGTYLGAAGTSFTAGFLLLLKRPIP